MSLQGRVLLIDDNPDYRLTLARVLRLYGYAVWEADNAPDARALIDTQYFHVAVIDVRLLDSDEGNREGLSLMHYIKKTAPSIAVIILTGYAKVDMVMEALQPDVNGQPAAFDFLEKNADIHENLPAGIERSFEHYLHINRQLLIHDEAQIFATLLERMRLTPEAAIDGDELVLEMQDLLKKLFQDCESIRISVTSEGRTRAVVLQVEPHYIERGAGEMRIAKLGEQAIIAREVSNYKQMVAGTVGGNRIPVALDVSQTRRLAGINYTFAGLGAVQSFYDFFNTSDIPAITPVVQNLFEKTCANWQRSRQPGTVPLKERFFELFEFTPASLTEIRDHMTQGSYPFRQANGKLIWQERALLDPIAFVLNTPLDMPYEQAIQHCDLHSHNILVDHRHETWLIDFGATQRAPSLNDYATFETFLRVDSHDRKSLPLLYAWEQCLFQSGIAAVDIPLPEDADLAKCQAAIMATRQIVLATPGQETLYLVSLLFNTLRKLALRFLPYQRRNHALLSASMIAGCLQETLS